MSFEATGSLDQTEAVHNANILAINCMSLDKAAQVSLVFRKLAITSCVKRCIFTCTLHHILYTRGMIPIPADQLLRLYAPTIDEEETIVNNRHRQCKGDRESLREMPQSVNVKPSITSSEQRHALKCATELRAIHK